MLLKIDNINPNINIGDYNNIVQDSHKYRKSSVVVIIFWELINITEKLSI